MAISATALAGGVAPAARADGVGVAASLGGSPELLDGLEASVGPNGYGRQPNAADVPFFGADPTKDVAGLFGALDRLDRFRNFSPDPNAVDPQGVIAERVQQVDDALGGGEQLDPPIVQCAGGSCDGKKVADIVSIRVRLTIGSGADKTGKRSFSLGGLDALSFRPRNAPQLDVALGWQVRIDLVATEGSPLRIESVPNEHPLALTAKVTLPGGPLKVDLGVLRVNATPVGTPSFSGTLFVDLQGDRPSFSFDPAAAFDARWKLATAEDSPLRGVGGELHIGWMLGGAPGASLAGLRVDLEKLTLNTGDLVGKDLNAAAASVRQITHPIRSITAPLRDPLPGLSEVADVSLLDIAERAGFSKDVGKGLSTLAAIDDGLTLAGGGTVDVGSLSLTGSSALSAGGLPNVAGLKTVLDACGPCKTEVDKLLGKANPGGASFQFDFPLLKDPKSLAGLLLGRDVEIFTFDTGKGNLSAKTDPPINIPLLNLLIFSVNLRGNFEASLHLRGGFDTAGIRAAAQGENPGALLNGLYLQDPGDSVARLISHVGISATAALVAEIEGAIDLNVNLEVPGPPGAKLRPFALGDGLACELLRHPDAKATFGVSAKATIDIPIVPTFTRTLAEHTFFTKQDLCPSLRQAVVARRDENGVLTIIPASERRVPAGEPDTIKVFARHGAGGAVTSVVVTANGNSQEFTDPVTAVRYSSPDGDNRPVQLRVVRNDGIPFEKPVAIKTAGGNDDVLLDLDPAINTRLELLDGNDRYTGSAGVDDVFGGSGDDSLDGGGGNDLLHGGPGNDSLAGKAGADRLDGEEGDDLLGDSSPDHNVLRGGVGNDQLISGPGADDLFGDDSGPNLGPDQEGPAGGRDFIVTGGGADTVVGGNGGDLIVPTADRSPVANGSARVLVLGNGGDDRIVTSNGPDEIHGGPGDDDISAGSGNNVITGGANLDAITSLGGADTIHGNAGNDTINAGDGANTVRGGSGADRIDTGSATDTVFGDDGQDTCIAPVPESAQPPETAAAGGGDAISTGAGADLVAAELGDDTVSAGAGGDVVCGHAGADVLRGNDEDDVVWGGSGADNVSGGSGADRLYGGLDIDDMAGDAGPDLLFGQGEDDRISGGAEADRIEGGDGNDTADGDEHDDLILGQNGSDRLLGSAGADRIEGGDGADRADGGDGPDLVLGQNGDDPELLGGPADDRVEGGAGADLVRGGDGQDDIIGGNSPDFLPAGATTASLGDAGDTLLAGDGGSDVIVGDNGRIDRGATPSTDSSDPDDPPRVRRTVVLRDLAIGGGDAISGGDGGDLILGAAGDDAVNGGAGNDQLEGNTGSDALDGDAGADDVIGGSSPLALPAGTTTASLPDAGDRLVGGGDGGDALIGDNGSIAHVLAADGRWARTMADGTFARTVTLLDRLTGGGGDTMSGGTGNDRVWGGLGNDRVHAGTGDDFVEGNQGSDILSGSAGGDDIVGGTSPQATGGDAQAAAKTPDGDDLVYGRAADETDQIAGSALVVKVDLRLDGAGLLLGVLVRYGPEPEPPAGTEPDDDVVLGDNARIDRCKPTLEGLKLVWHGRDDCSWKDITVGFYGPATARHIQPLGEALPVLGLLGQLGVLPTDRAGKDTINGNDDDDLLLGQDGGDTIHGGAGDDIVYGGLDLNKLYGDGGGVDVVVLGDLSLLRLVGVSI